MMSEFMRYGTFRNYDFNVPIIGINDVYSYVRYYTGMWWIAAGERINDSIVRRAMIKNSGTIDEKRGRIYPVATWTKAETLHYMKMKKLRVGGDSRALGFSFRSLEGNQLYMLKQKFPEDYEKIRRLYPFCDSAVKRFETYGK